MDIILKNFLKIFFLFTIVVFAHASNRNDLDQEAFESSMEDTFPLSAEQIESIKKTFDKENAAMSEPAEPVPVGQTSTRQISLSPGSEIPIVRLSKGYISTLVFLDSTGQPWPISNYSIGDPNIFNIQWDKATNVLFIQPQITFAHGNIGVRLEGSPTPLMLQLACGRGDVDYRLDLTVPGHGPYAQAQEMSYHDSAYPLDNTLSEFLDGKMLAGATPLRLSPQVGQAWLYQGQIILRLHSTVISPQWLSYSSSSDGMKVYKMPRVNSFVVSEQGRTQTIRIDGA